MEYIKKQTVVLAFLLFVAVQQQGLAAQSSAREILANADAIFQQNRIYSTSSLTITRNGRAQAEQRMENYSLTDADGTVRNLTLFTAPARVKGTAYLTVGDGLWVRFASTGRIRKLSSSARKNSAGGSDFAYADMGDGNKGYSDKYVATMDGEESLDGQAQYRLELKPKAGSSSDETYEKLLVWVAKDTGYYSQIQFWDKGAPIKILSLGDYRSIGGLTYPYTVSMRSLVKDSVSVIRTETIEVDSPKVRENLFSNKYLETL